MPDGATLIRPTSGSRIGLCLMALRFSGLHLATSGYIWLKSRPDKAFRRHPALQR
ncbi:hypothetical protein GTC03_003586 [Salmonella enterica]|nr:hypothetical protein [Salmonella enterica]